jgi:hypothetical protein
LTIKNTDIVRELSLPPVKIHCSVLAEDAIRAAIADLKNKTKWAARGCRFECPTHGHQETKETDSHVHHILPNVRPR